jgi:hypothetical protein
MSHLHSIAGTSRASAEYQEYLERLRVERLAEQEEKLRKKARARRFESYIEPDQNSRRNARQSPDREAENGSTNEADPAEGFGTHYA